MKRLGIFVVVGLGWLGRPAYALPCDDFVSLLDAEVKRSVVQRIVLESPPEDGWGCFSASGHTVGELGMARAFAALNSNDNLLWTVRFKQCEASVGLRRSTRRLLADKDGPPVREDDIGPETRACKQATALQEAIRADAAEHP